MGQRKTQKLVALLYQTTIVICSTSIFTAECKVVVDSNLQSSRCVFKVSLAFLSIVNFTNNFHNFIILLNLLKFN